MLPVPFGRRSRLTSAVGPDASGSNPGIEWFHTPEKSGMDAVLRSAPCAAGSAVASTVCAQAGDTASPSATSTRKSRRKCMFSPPPHQARLLQGHRHLLLTPVACAFGRDKMPDCEKSDLVAGYPGAIGQERCEHEQRGSQSFAGAKEPVL